MKKKISILVIAFALIACFITAATGQEPDTVKYWKTDGVFSVNLAQSGFSHWAAGGQDAISINGLINLTANYKKNKSAWDNSLSLGYGKMKTKGTDLGWVKTDDKIDFLSKYGIQASKAWYYSALLSFKSQMDKGFNYPNTTDAISNLFSPAYVLFSLGMDYKPSPVFSAFISPLTAKTTFVLDDALSTDGAFGVDPGKKFRGEFGAYANFLLKKDEILKNVSFQSKLDLFSNYLHNPQNIDVSWENLLVLKVNKFISATISTHLLYDDDITVNVNEDSETPPVLGKRVQFKEVIGVGFTYKFNN